MIDSINNVSNEAVQKATTRSWEEWIALLDEAKQYEQKHADIVKYIAREVELDNEWWCQMVTVGYEIHKGLRKKHESTNGFQANGSKTFQIPVEALYTWFKDEAKRAKWLFDPVEIRTDNENKSMRWTWCADNSIVGLYFMDKGPNKSSMSINHTKLETEEQAYILKAFWKERLTALNALIKLIGV